MQRILLRWIFVTLTIMAVPYVVPGISVEGLGTALATAAVLAIFNVILKPLLILFTLPLTLLTLGLFLLIINAIIFHLATMFVSGIQVESFWSSLLASLFISLVSWFTNLSLTKSEGTGRTYRRIVMDDDGRRMRDVTPESKE